MSSFSYTRRSAFDTSSVDVSLSTSNVIMPAHRAVLAAGSPYFDAMFSGAFLESGDAKVIEIRSVSVKIFEACILFLYFPGEAILELRQTSLVELLEIWLAADMLQITDLLGILELNVFPLRLQSSDLFRIREMAVDRGRQQFLSEIIDPLIAWNISKVNAKLIPALPIDVFKNLLHLCLWWGHGKTSNLDEIVDNYCRDNRVDKNRLWQGTDDSIFTERSITEFEVEDDPLTRLHSTPTGTCMAVIQRGAVSSSRSRALSKATYQWADHLPSTFISLYPLPKDDLYGQPKADDKISPMCAKPRFKSWRFYAGMVTVGTFLIISGGAVKIEPISSSEDEEEDDEEENDDDEEDYGDNKEEIEDDEEDYDDDDEEDDDENKEENEDDGGENEDDTEDVDKDPSKGESANVRAASVDDGAASEDDGAASGDDGAASGDDGNSSGDDGNASGDDGNASGDVASGNDDAGFAKDNGTTSGKVKYNIINAYSIKEDEDQFALKRTVYRVCLQSLRRDELGPLSFFRYRHALVSTKDYLFAIGGIGGLYSSSSKILLSVERLDLRTASSRCSESQFEDCSPMPLTPWSHFNQTGHSACVSDDNTIFVIGADAVLLRYNVRADSWTLLRNFNSYTTNLPETDDMETRLKGPRSIYSPPEMICFGGQRLILIGEPFEAAVYDVTDDKLRDLKVLLDERNAPERSGDGGSKSKRVRPNFPRWSKWTEPEVMAVVNGRLWLGSSNLIGWNHHQRQFHVFNEDMILVGRYLISGAERPMRTHVALPIFVSKVAKHFKHPKF